MIQRKEVYIFTIRFKNNLSTFVIVYPSLSLCTNLPLQL